MRLQNHGKPIDVEASLADFAAFLSRQEDVLAVFLIGSYGTPEQTPLSDLDLAFVFRQDAVPDPDGHLDLIQQVTAILREDDVSVTLLNGASSVVQMRVLESGKLLHCADDVAFADYKERVFGRYADFKIPYDRFLKEYDTALVESYGEPA